MYQRVCVCVSDLGIHVSVGVRASDLGIHVYISRVRVSGHGHLSEHVAADGKFVDTCSESD